MTDDDPTPPRGSQVPPQFAAWRRPRLAIPPPPPPSKYQLQLACARIAELEARLRSVERMQTLLITVLAIVGAEKVRLLSWLAEWFR